MPQAVRRTRTRRGGPAVARSKVTEEPLAAASLRAGATPGQRNWAGLLVILSVGMIMAAWTWRKWPDVLVDFGRELYVPWQLSQGHVLYTDISYFNGPLSPYLNTLWFKLFGVSLMTLCVCNMVILVGVVWLTYRVLSAVSSAFAATMACVLFLTVFAFGQLVNVGNYNFICPYSHEMTHGLALSVGAIYLFYRYLQDYRVVFLVVCGLALGLAFLTKLEVFAAAALALVLGLALSLSTHPMPWGRRVGHGAVFLVCLISPAVAAFGLLQSAMPAGTALRATLGSWWSVFEGNVTANRFYKRGMGTLDAWANLKTLLVWTGWYLVALLPAVALALAVRGRRMLKLAAGAAAFLAAMLVAAYFYDLTNRAGDAILRRATRLADLPRPIPLFMLVMAAGWFVVVLKRRKDAARRPRHITAFVFVVFATALLVKMILHTRFQHYGFGLALPAALVMVVVLLDWLPRRLDHMGGYGGALRAAGLAYVLVAITMYLEVVDVRLGAKTTLVAHGTDAFYADARGRVVNDALAVIERDIAPDQTLSVMPEGVMLNYLARRLNPTPYYNLMPIEMDMLGPDRIRASLRDHPPDYIALAHKNTSEYGVRFFGQDYAQDIFQWIRSNYHPLELVGAAPFTSTRFGILFVEANRRQATAD